MKDDGNYSRDYSKIETATDFLRTYAAKLTELADSGNWAKRTHAHVIATRATLNAYANAMRDILKTPADEHEAHLNELLLKIEDRLRDEEIVDYHTGMDTNQVVCQVAGSVRNDLRAVSDYLITKKLEDTL